MIYIHKKSEDKKSISKTYNYGKIKIKKELADQIDKSYEINDPFLYKR